MTSYTDPYSESNISNEGFKKMQQLLFQLPSTRENSMLCVGDIINKTSSQKTTVSKKEFDTFYSLCKSITSHSSFSSKQCDPRLRRVYKELHWHLSILKEHLARIGIETPSIDFETDEEKRVRDSNEAFLKLKCARQSLIDASKYHTKLLGDLRNTKRTLERILYSDPMLRIDGLSHSEQQSIIDTAIYCLIPKLEADLQHSKSRIEEFERQVRAAEAPEKWYK